HSTPLSVRMCKQNKPFRSRFSATDRKGEIMSRFIVFLCLAACFSLSVTAAPQPCEQLAQLALPNTKITSAQTIAAGAFSPPQAASPWLIGDPSLYKQLPAFCRATPDDKPTPDSDIKIEVWMPATGWNGKFRGQGNGGFAGEMDYRSLALAALPAYASSATHTRPRRPRPPSLPPRRHRHRPRRQRHRRNVGARPSGKNCRLRPPRHS